MKACLLFLLFPATASFAQQAAPDTFVVKNAPNFLQPYEKKYIQYTETKEGLIQFNALLTRKAEKTELNGRKAWLFIQTYQSDKTIDTDSSFCDEQTLQPIAYNTAISSEEHLERVLFTKQGVVNRIIYKDSANEFTQPNHDRYNGVISNDLVATLPLAANRIFVLKTVNPGLRYMEYLTTVTVEGKEDLTVAGIGTIPCWKIHVSEGGGTSSTEWYSVNGRHQIKMIYKRKNGSVFMRVLVAG